LWWTIPFTFILILLGADASFDLQVHDSYFLIASIHNVIICTSIIVTLGAIYWAARDTRQVN